MLIDGPYYLHKLTAAYMKFYIGIYWHIKLGLHDVTSWYN